MGYGRDFIECPVSGGYQIGFDITNILFDSEIMVEKIDFDGLLR